MNLRIPASILGLLALLAAPAGAQEAEGTLPTAPTDFRAKEKCNHARLAIRLRWDRGEAHRVSGYEILRSVAGGEYELLTTEPPVAVEYVDVINEISKYHLEALETAQADFATLDADESGGLTAEEFPGPYEAFKLASPALPEGVVEPAEETYGEKCEHVDPTKVKKKPDHVVTPAGIAAALAANGIDPDRTYSYRIVALSSAGARAAPVDLPAPLTAQRNALSSWQWNTARWFDWSRGWFLVVVAVICFSIIFYIFQARSGKELKIRKIAGLEAVDEAVGRATEMGRSVLFVVGTQDLNEIQTIAGITVLAHVARTAAEYDAKVEVPTSRSLVMTTARETVQAAFLAAGRPDAYNQDLIYYVTDEQFGFVAYLSGMMVREKPAACFYMGAFYAESLILAETGNSIGAIQIAGTAMPAQLPFFVAACDYTLIGEEFFAASAYLSGSPEELGSLKGQDVGKALVAAILIIGCSLATLAAVTDSEALRDVVAFITDSLLT